MDNYSEDDEDSYSSEQEASDDAVQAQVSYYRFLWRPVSEQTLLWKGTVINVKVADGLKPCCRTCMTRTMMCSENQRSHGGK